MRISKKAHYALRSMLAIARAPEGRPVPISELCAGRDIPQKFLEQILLTLRRADLLISRRGAGGGYLLARRPSDINLADIITPLDGGLGIAPAPDDQMDRGLALALGEVEETLQKSLTEETLATILERGRDTAGMDFAI